MAKAATKRTPLMRQYHQIKSRYPDTLLLFRLGDFYETFEQDATTTADICGITLTKRGNGTESETPLAGFPWHQLDNYLPRLVKAGYRVAICEQMEDPKSARGIVKRDVVEVVTPGVAMNEKLLESSDNVFLTALSFGRDRVGLAFCDVSTGEFAAAEVYVDDLAATLEGIGPAEIIVNRAQRDRIEDVRLSTTPTVTRLEEWIFDRDFAEDRLREQFGTKSLKGFGIENLGLGVVAAGAVMHYLQETQKTRLGHIARIRRYNPGEYIALDPSTKRNLEIVTSSASPTLFEVINRTSTPMGGRMLKRWIVHPLKSVTQIRKRLEGVADLHDNPSFADELVRELRTCSDIERIVGRVAVGRASPRDLGFLLRTLLAVPRIVELCSRCASTTIKSIAEAIDIPTGLVDELQNAIADEPPATLSDGSAFRTGYSPELDELRELLTSGRDYLAQLQERERKRTGIPSLKVGFNNVFGYYLEITNTHKDRVPENYTRKQTLTNSERYITPELKEYEEKIVNAEERIARLERELFTELQLRVADSGESLMSLARLLAMLDCLLGFSRVARERSYVRPELDETTEIEIKSGRHPVVETMLPPGETYVPNDTSLNTDAEQIAIITGPNMAGKSSYLRQNALIVLLAQIGSFVPAESARIGVVDKIFTRVGAQDNIAAGESTFLVEMHEAANILNNATDRSLILLDEVGRGTSTFDGVSIAWAIAEYLHDKIGARTLFATHYHELNALTDRFARIVNLKVEVREVGDRIVFLRNVTPGTADHSYGIEVARMAGLPKDVTGRAAEIMAHLEESSTQEIAETDSESESPAMPNTRKPQPSSVSPPVSQISMFELSATDPQAAAVKEKLKELDLDRITPVDALMMLKDLKEMTRTSGNSE
jgi:DNA mismatch repair protein MutS